MPPQRLRARPVLVTLVDAGLIVAASAAMVVLLGGRTRIELAGVGITIRGATNLLALAAACGALRLLIGRGSRLLPAVSRSNDAAIEEERERFVNPPAATREVWLCGAAALLGSLVWIVPHLRDIRQVPEPGDPVFSAWRIARLAHQVTHDPRHLFDGNIFYPRPLTLTYSDSTLLEGLVGMPFVLAGVDPLIVANVLTVIAFPVCGLAFFYAAWRLTVDPRAALVAGLVGTWYPFHAEHYSHLELEWMMFIPLAIVTGLRLLADPRVTTGLRFGAAVTGQWLASMYLGVILVSFLAPFMAIMAVAWRIVPSRRLAVAFVAAVAIIAPAFAGLGLFYVKSAETRGERGRQEVSTYSAAPADYGYAYTSLATYRGQSRQYHRSERELFPGTSTLVLAAAGLVPPLTGATIATIAAGALAFDWSLGLNGLTYDDLFSRSSVFRGMRVPARFSALVGAALALLAGFGARRVLRVTQSPLAGAAVCSILVVSVLFDLRMELLLQPYHRTIPSIYSRVTSDMVLVELPSEPQIEYMYFSTFHWASLLGGYSGYPGSSSLVAAGWKVFPSGTSIELFRRAGATHLTYNCALEKRRSHCGATVEQLDANPALEILASERWEGADVRLYRIN